MNFFGGREFSVPIHFLLHKWIHSIYNALQHAQNKAKILGYLSIIINGIIQYISFQNTLFSTKLHVKDIFLL